MKTMRHLINNAGAIYSWFKTSETEGMYVLTTSRAAEKFYGDELQEHVDFTMEGRILHIHTPREELV